MRRGAPPLRLVRMLPPSKPHKVKSTRAQRAHREVAWAVYISEGYAANMRSAEFLNAHEMPAQARAMMRHAIRQTEAIVRVLRTYL